LLDVIDDFREPLMLDIVFKRRHVKIIQKYFVNLPWTPPTTDNMQMRVTGSVGYRRLMFMKESNAVYKQRLQHYTLIDVKIMYAPGVIRHHANMAEHGRPQILLKEQEIKFLPFQDVMVYLSQLL
jgi:hypothetical protein